ncbi:hypothetical protein EUTSA_v10002899mg [Eutrema salsugineum]|uniref:DUF674 domain-containing protein n=1 Tax=Eutrema salsugineum TaxID=72664 RepID=V4LC24_EUTSA|nr:hypothetical protein EUTSA_v10002899mg [Eutrema salsugineum]
MANSAVKPKFTLRLLIDEEKNRVVLAEAGKDFVDVLCSLLTLPMGTIVRLLEKHQAPQSSVVGCFHNLYKSVSDMNVDNFENQARKNLLLYPRSIKESYCRKLKLNIDDTKATKFFVCPYFASYESCSKVYSNTSSSQSRCGHSMTYEIQVQEREQGDGSSGNKVDGVFPSCRTSFIITDDLKVALTSMGLVLNVLNDLGYAGFDNLQEMLIDVGFEEVLEFYTIPNYTFLNIVCSHLIHCLNVQVLTLLGCLFTSEAPLTDTFLRKHCMTRKRKALTPLGKESRFAGDSDKQLTLKVYVRKTDKAILYAECREDFVDFLFSFLVIPLEFAWELSIDNVNMGCVGNLCRSVKDLSFEKQKEAIASKFSRKIKDVPSNGDRIVKFTSMDPSYGGVGFVKGETNFIVSDDLVITPMNSSSTISLLSKLQMNISDIEEQVINISKAEAVSLLRASLITTSVLTNGLSNFLLKMKPQAATQSTSKIPKSEKTL